MKFTTLIPLRFNAGTEVPPKQMTRIIDELAFQFRGCLDESVTKGNSLTHRIRGCIVTKANGYRLCEA